MEIFFDGILSLDVWVLVFLMAAAFFAGFVDSVAGGGGLISLPAMLVAGIPEKMALGTGKFMATCGTTASFITFARNGAVAWPIACIGFAFSLLGSAGGARTVLYVDNALLGKIILVLLPLAALCNAFSARAERTIQGPPRGSFTLYALTSFLCFCIGFYDGFFGPGTGSFLLIALHLAIRLDLVKASGTAKAFNLASNISGLTIFLIYGKVLFTLAIPMACANIAGNIAGTRLALRKGPRLVQRMLYFSLTLLFASLVWRYYL